MCGIVGMISVGEQGNNQFGMMIPNVIYRGRDYFGFSFQDNTGAVHTTKDPNLTKLLQQYMIQTNATPMKWAMANARAIPESEWIEHPDGAKDSDCQPAESENFVCVLNGCISNDKELRKKYKLEVESTVDTYVIPALLEFYIDKGLSPDNAISNTIMELEGSFACIIAHKNTSTFYVLSNFVPLYTVYDPIAQIYYFASMPEWFEVLKGCTYAQSIAPYKMCKIQPGKKILTTSILKTLPNKRMLCICSSGMDSLTTARLYQCLGYEVELLHYDYGCAASEKEIENIQRAAQLMNMKLRILDAKTIFDMFKGKSRLLTDDKTLNDGAPWLADCERVISYVPARNAIFAIVAASIAEQEEFTYISQGLNLIDGSAYPDNQLTYLTKMNELMPYALSWNSNVQFKAPLVHLTKREILQLALHIGVPLQFSWSCYRSKRKRCGDCGPDKFRMYAFQKLGYRDIVDYEKIPEGFWDNCEDIPSQEINLMKNPRVKLPNPKEHALWEYIRKEI